MHAIKNFIFFLCTLCAVIYSNNCLAQCGTPVSAFPYSEGFEASDGNWTVNGTAPDWEWGSPLKPVINSAASGSKCWVTGGLTNGFYNNGESSWLQSPCFDFSSLRFPYISFNVWWETENGFDGGNLQYSIDNGISWSNVGSSSDPANCLNSNWYNSPSVRFLQLFGSGTDGWSGSVQNSCPSSGGSGGWVTATHTMPALAGLRNVIFRFTFGAGTQCNGFDGFGIDDILIQEAPPNNGSIVSNCVDSNTVNFSFTTSLCPTSYSWNFDDAASGTNNTSTLPSPQHIFSAPGNYTVSLTVNGPDNAFFTSFIPVAILSLSTQVISPLNCSGAAVGSVKVNVSGNAGPFTYNWNTVPAQSAATAINLSGGSYTVNVSKTGACSIATTVTLPAPKLNVEDSVQQPGCLYAKGSIKLSVTEGAAPFTYSWLPAVSTDSVAGNLNTGSYTVTVTDSRNCAVTKNFTIASLSTPVVFFSGVTDVNCNGSHFGTAVANTSGGTAPFVYEWNTNPVQRNDAATNLKEGSYTVNVTDSNGCKTSATVSITVTGTCNDIYFPNSFAPDGINKFFSPLGNVVEISKYALTVYNRFGELVFGSSNPFARWDGSYKGKRASAGAYVWRANYLYKGKIKRNQYGTLMLIR